MACGTCGKNKIIDDNNQIVMAKKKNVEKILSKDVVIKGSPSDASGCLMKYSELIVLDKKAVKLFNHLRLSDPLGAKLFLELNAKLRVWIIKLKQECPDEELFVEAKKLIESEYTKYLQSN